MPNDTSQIIDLTEIVQVDDRKASHKTEEEEELMGHVSDLMSNEQVDDIELDDLLAQLNDGVENDEAASPEVNPNERLDLPGMDDMDAVVGQFEAPSADKDEVDIELDDLLAGLDDDAPPKPAAKPAPKPASAPKAAVSVSESDGLDDLLTDLDPPAASASAAPEKPAPQEPPDDDLDALLADLDSGKGAQPLTSDDELEDLLSDLDVPSAENAAPVKDDELDDLLADLESDVEQAEIVKDDELDDLLADLNIPAKPKRATPDHPMVDAHLEGLLDELDASLEAIGREAGEELDTADLDDLLGSAAAPSKAGTSAAAPRPGAPVEVEEMDFSPAGDDVDGGTLDLSDVLAEEENVDAALAEAPVAEPAPAMQAETPVAEVAEVAPVAAVAAAVSSEELESLRAQIGSLSPSVQTAMEQHQALREQVQGLTSGDDAVSAFETRLGGLEARLSDMTDELAALRERLDAPPPVPSPPVAPEMSDVEALAGQIMESMRPEIEKAAAAAAASIIREEILAVFAEGEA